MVTAGVKKRKKQYEKQTKGGGKKYTQTRDKKSGDHGRVAAAPGQPEFQPPAFTAASPVFISAFPLSQRAFCTLSPAASTPAARAVAG